MTNTLIKEYTLLQSLYEKRNEEYQNSDYKEVEFDINCGITEEEIQNFIDFIDSGKPFTITDVRTRALYLANKYKFSINSFWEYIMYRTGKWIRPKK